MICALCEARADARALLSGEGFNDWERRYRFFRCTCPRWWRVKRWLAEWAAAFIVAKHGRLALRRRR